jgi:hypothetical protein
MIYHERMKDARELDPKPINPELVSGMRQNISGEKNIPRLFLSWGKFGGLIDKKSG